MAPPPPDPAKGLPPVVAPSGRFIAQLFLVPGLIVAASVTVLLGFSWLAGGPRTPAVFLRDLQSGNADIRWRTASDLAQVLRRDDALATNVGFGLKLADLLRQALDEQARMDRNRADRGNTATAEALAREKTAAQAQQAFVQYLTASLGALMTPVGAPVLADLARSNPRGDEATNAMKRRQAVWALASLGDSLGRLARLSDERKTAVLADLDDEAKGAGPMADWARQAANHLRGQGTPGVVAALVECSTADDPFLRAETAHALTFWSGSDSENKSIDATLLKLARDDGRGTPIEIEEKN